MYLQGEHDPRMCEKLNMAYMCVEVVFVCMCVWDMN